MDKCGLFTLGCYRESPVVIIQVALPDKLVGKFDLGDVVEFPPCKTYLNIE